MIRLFRHPSRVQSGTPERKPAMLQLEGVRKGALDTGKARLVVTATAFLVAFAAIAGRMVDVSIFKNGNVRAYHTGATAVPHPRADVIDRNGMLLATSLPSVSLYAHPREIHDPSEAARKIATVLPEVPTDLIETRLRSEKGFVYLMRNLTPRQEYQVNALGIPGLYFEQGDRRVYPQGALASHIVGITDLDNKGVSGIEKSFDKQLESRREPLRLSLDLRVQTVLHDELAKTVANFKAVGAAGVVMSVRTGELLGMVSLPDFDPNRMASASADDMFNRATLGVYEMGSTFKLFTAAAALDSGVANINSTFDASHPIKVARFEITDYHGLNRWLSVPEILIYSSNIGAAKMALEMGTETQRNYLGRFGLLKQTALEIPESGAPLVPQVWREINTMTISYGHGLAVTPLQLTAGVSSLVNGGVFYPPTLLAKTEDETVQGRQVIKPQTSAALRRIMRMVVTEGTGENADVPGYNVGGKTGTAEKTGVGGYRKKLNLSSFISTFPTDDPEYVVLVMIDEPQGTKETHGFTTGGWTAAPAIGRIISQIGPMLGVRPVPGPENASDKQRVAQSAPAQNGAARRVAFAATE